MTAETEPGQHAVVKRLLRSLGVFAVFSGIGPAIGGLLVFSVVYPTIALFALDGAADAPASTWFSLLGPLTVFVAAAYAFGGVQAVLTGAWAAAAAWRHRTFSQRATIFAAIVATLIWIAVLYSPLDPLDATDAGGPDKIGNATQIALSLTPIGVACALVCRWISRKLRLIDDGG